MDFIKIDGWSNPRALGVHQTGKHLDIQIKAICDDCRECKERVQIMKDRLVALGIEGSWRADDAILVVPRPCIDESSKSAKEEWLSHLFGVPVRFVRWVQED